MWSMSLNVKGVLLSTLEKWRTHSVYDEQAIDQIYNIDERTDQWLNIFCQPITPSMTFAIMVVEKIHKSRVIPTIEDGRKAIWIKVLRSLTPDGLDINP